MGNIEGSRVIPNVFRVRKNLKLRVSAEQMSLLLGAIVGDAYIYPQGKICIEHSSQQVNYLKWKFNKFKLLAYPKVARVERFDKRTGKTNISYRFFLRQYFRPLRQMFYKKGRKRIPRGIDAYFNPMLVSVWYMDDGHLDKGIVPILATESFVSKDLKYLAGLFKKRLGVEVRVTSKNRIRVRSSSKLKFFRLIDPFLCEYMRYKLP